MQLLEHENKQLRGAFDNEKKRRQRGKALLLAPPDDYAGGALFYSPLKVQAARDKQQQIDLEAAQLTAQKSAAALQKEQDKLVKEQLAEERRQGRARAAEAKKVEAARKAEQKEQLAIDREVNKQLQQDVQLSKKSKRLSIKAPARSKKPQVAVVDALEPVVAEAAPLPTAATTTRRGRAVKLPAKFV